MFDSYFLVLDPHADKLWMQGDAFVTVQTLEEEEAQQEVKPRRQRATPRKRISPMQSRRHSQVPFTSYLTFIHSKVPFTLFSIPFVCSFIHHLNHAGCILIMSIYSRN